MGNTDSIPEIENNDDVPMDIDQETEDVGKSSENIDEGDKPLVLSVTDFGTSEYNGLEAKYLAIEVDQNVDKSILQSKAMTEALFKAYNEKFPNPDQIKSSAPNKKAKTNLKKPKQLTWKKSGPVLNDSKDNDPYKDILLDSVGGLEYQKQWLDQCILKPLKNNPSNPWGLNPPKGVLFYGNPGTGKTLLARALGNELSKQLGYPVKFFHRKGGDVFNSYFGESSKNLRDLFQEAILAKPSIIFFDELDGLCPNREEMDSQCQSYISVVTTLLGLMDTLPAGEVFVIGATNRLDAVDPAMKRPGRFDKHLEFFPPNTKARNEILRINTSKWKKESKLSLKDLDNLSLNTVGFTGADIENLCREAFFAAFDRHVPGDDLKESIEDMKVIQEDWTTALKKVKPSQNGSNLFIPVLPNKAINPLIKKIQAEILTSLIQNLPISPLNSNEDNNNNNSMKISSIYLWSDTPYKMDDLGTTILPGILTNEKVADYPVYILNDIQTYPGVSAKVTYIKGTIEKALDCVKPCILYIPNLDNILEDNHNQIANVLSNQLVQFNGKQVLLLATASCPPTRLNSDMIIKNIFSGKGSCIAVRNASRKERKEFFLPIFGTFAHMMVVKKGTNNGSIPNEIKKTLEKILEKVLLETENEYMEGILALHNAFLQAAEKYSKDCSDRRGLPACLIRIIDEFEKNSFFPVKPTNS